MLKTATLVREYRLKHHKTQFDVGQSVGASGQLISNFERGAAPLTLPKLVEVAKYLEIPMDKIKEAIIEDKTKNIESVFADIA